MTAPRDASDGVEDALIGYTGFVGGNLDSQYRFGHRYSSTTINQSAGRHFGTVVVSAARAEKWRINQDPQTDRAHLDALQRSLAGFTADRVVLISTVDVYKTPVGVDEHTAVPERGLHPYGEHRSQLENFVRNQFEKVLVVRLPGLFGPGIKKNVIYDFLNANNLSQIDRRSVFQYYNLALLWGDIRTALAADLTLVNLATQPLATGDLARRCFGIEFDNELSGSVPGRYDIRSAYAEVFGGSNGYLYSTERIVDDLCTFVQAERAR